MKTLNIFAFLFALVLSFNAQESFGQVKTIKKATVDIDPRGKTYLDSIIGYFVPHQHPNSTRPSTSKLNFQTNAEFKDGFSMDLPQGATTREAAANTKCLNNLKQLTLFTSNGQSFTFNAVTNRAGGTKFVSRETKLTIQQETSGKKTRLVLRNAATF
ncbi:MAG: hypothetical protein AAF502_21185 [Bacteroidota bacterium]